MNLITMVGVNSPPPLCSLDTLVYFACISIDTCIVHKTKNIGIFLMKKGGNLSAKMAAWLSTGGISIVITGKYITIFWEVSSKT